MKNSVKPEKESKIKIVFDGFNHKEATLWPPTLTSILERLDAATKQVEF